MKPSEFINASRDHVDKGWTKGTVEDEEGNVCAVGAMRRTATEALGQKPSLDRFADVMNAAFIAAGTLQQKAIELAGRPVAIASYNDTREQKQEALDWFDKAASGLEESGQ